MAREYWDFNEHADDYVQFLRRLSPPFALQYSVISKDGEFVVTPASRVGRVTFEPKPLTPPDPPEWIRRLNEEANADPPEWIRRLNEEARRAAPATAADRDGPE